MHEGILVPLATFTFVVLIVWIRSVNTRMVKPKFRRPSESVIP